MSDGFESRWGLVQDPNGDWLSHRDRELLRAKEAAGAPVVAVAVADPVAEAVAIARSANIESLDQIDWTQPARSEHEAKIRAALLAQASKKCAKATLLPHRLVPLYFEDVGIPGPGGPGKRHLLFATDLSYLAEDARAAIQKAYNAAKAFEEIKEAPKAPGHATARHRRHRGPR